jgi:hypothetical protein
MTIFFNMSVVLSFFKHITLETGSVFTNMWDETNGLYTHLLENLRRYQPQTHQITLLIKSPPPVTTGRV